MSNNQKSDKKIFAFMNAYTFRKDGGDVIFLELCKYFNQYKYINKNILLLPVLKCTALPE
ncbi:MAG: hypothetical protein ACYCTB_00650 [bacterium]